MKYAALVLEDGSVWTGRGFGASRKAAGEVVFNTGMVGYVQSITDPSYRGEILCQTYPLVGNYGVSPLEFESEGPQISGYIVSEQCEHPSHHTSRMSLDIWLERNGVPGISGIDTRELTKALRTKGTMLGILEVSPDPLDMENLLDEVQSVEDPNTRDLVAEVTVREPLVYPAAPDAFMNPKPGIALIEYFNNLSKKPSGGLRIAVIDCGVKRGIIQSIQIRGADVIRVPAAFQEDDLLALEPDGVVISNGPGDPKKAGYLSGTLKKIIGEKIPVFGICLGNQILALAMGCDTYKLKFGHRGQNHPVLSRSNGRSYITSQNHGFAVDPESVEKSDLQITYTNGNDETVEGIAHRELPVAAVQFHPEARPGPLDTGFLFDDFLGRIKRK